ncbi:MAG: ATP synthase F1 subunit delta [Kiritimatiellaeota bacterium]|nr:ATP synthase F1 subunit delta [Kiritimatiellota bacterium]
MTNEHSISFKYAKALFLSAEEKGVLDEVGDDSAKILSTLKGTPELDSFLKNPAALEKETCKAVRLLFHDIVGETTRRFLVLLTNKRRISLLEMILKRFERLRDDAMNIVRARLEYAGELTVESKKKLIDGLLGGFNGSDVVLDEVERPTLIGGLRLVAGGRLYDNSVRTSIKRLRRHLISGTTIKNR